MGCVRVCRWRRVRCVCECECVEVDGRCRGGDVIRDIFMIAHTHTHTRILTDLVKQSKVHNPPSQLLSIRRDSPMP